LRFERYGRGAEKNSSQKMPRNPLKSLDSDERIQGNPSKSNLISGVFAAKRPRAKKTQTEQLDQFHLAGA
jgi:hypothetical protein